MDTTLGPLPTGLGEFLVANDGAEGFVGESYLALWPIDRIKELNDLLETATFAPGLTVFGTDGGEEAFAVDRTTSPPTIVTVPLVGLGHVPATPVAEDLAGLLQRLGGSAISAMPDASPTRGNIAWTVQPLLFGGHPSNPENKRMVPLVDALKMAAWWNHRVHELGATT